MAYRTRVVERHDGTIDGSVAVAIDDPRQGHRMGVALPVEHDRWIVTLGSFHGDPAPTDPASFEDAARTLPAPELAAVLACGDAQGTVQRYRMPTSRRRHVERAGRVAPGFVVLGDAVCSVNPVYGQGMTSAALQALALGECVGRFGPASDRLPATFYRRAARVVDVPWRIAAGGDFADPRTSGAKPVGTDLTNRFLERVFRACHSSPAVARQTQRVQNLLDPPSSLLRPDRLLRILLADRRARAAERRSAVGALSRGPALAPPESVDRHAAELHRRMVLR
ncbi:hypothetical protein [Isoptericola sp. AK164]|uniref:hypothetical protein n=1 Tax=Isoptericola sp. AK164 TaxID=3024246 RepID=UPI0024182DE5|nr:hypothetical protein [Isoptericola sp. AK164]